MRRGFSLFGGKKKGEWKESDFQVVGKLEEGGRGKDKDENAVRKRCLVWKGTGEDGWERRVAVEISRTKEGETWARTG